MLNHTLSESSPVTPHQFKLRRATLEDITNLCIVELKAIKDEQRMHPFNMSLSELTSVWKMRLKSGKFDIVVAVDALNNDRLVGFIALQAPSHHEAFLQAIYVDPLYYRRKVGTMLMALCDKLCKLRFCPVLRLHVEPLNRNGLSFYKKLGFTVTNRKFHHLNILVKEYSSC